jgi:hypothetical protein
MDYTNAICQTFLTPSYFWLQLVQNASLLKLPRETTVTISSRETAIPFFLAPSVYYLIVRASE